ncbi:MAG: hypothetical protein LBO63_01090 [Oscillospiraceae bacterium]|jgi:hypothetical protein|nr:hypothetical protein [Oscillospiraceae bacterium]
MKKKLIVACAVVVFIAMALLGYYVVIRVFYPEKYIAYLIEKEMGIDQYNITAEYGDVFTAEFDHIGLHPNWSIVAEFNDEISQLYMTSNVLEVGIVGVIDNEYVRIYRVGSECIFRRKSENNFCHLTKDFQDAEDLIPIIKGLLESNKEIEEIYGSFIADYEAPHG